MWFRLIRVLLVVFLDYTALTGYAFMLHFNNQGPVRDLVSSVYVVWYLNTTRRWQVWLFMFYIHAVLMKITPREFYVSFNQ